MITAFPEKQELTEDAFAKDLLKVSGLMLMLTLLLHGVAAAHFIVLYLDGAYYLFEVIHREDFLLIEPTSRTVQLLQQAPVILALRLGLNDLEMLMRIAGFANLLLPLLLTMSCYWILPPYQKAFFIFPLLHYLAGTLASWSPTVTDAPLAASYFWMLFYLILFRSGTVWSALLCVLIALPALYLHEAISFLGPILIIAALWRSKNTPNPFLKVFFLLLSGWFLFAAYTQLIAISHPRDVNNRSEFLAQLQELKWIYLDGINVAVVLSMATAGLLLWVFIDNLRNSGRESSATARGIRRAAPFLLGGAILALWALLLFDVRWYGLTTQFAARAQSAFISVPLAILVLASLFQPSIQYAWRDRLQVILIALLAIGVLIGHGIGLSRWVDFVQDFRSLLQNHSGFISHEEAVTALPPSRRNNFRLISSAWTNPAISYLLSPHGRLTAIVGNPITMCWQPFDPLDLDNLPKGRNFDIGPYLEAIALQYCSGKKFYGYAQFNQLGKFSFINEIKGLSSHESWGRWSDNNQVVFHFKQPLPDDFNLIVDLLALGPNVGAPITVSAGATQVKLIAQAQLQIYTLEFKLTQPTSTLVFTVPKPVRPQDLGIGSDTRQIGLGFRSLRICSF